MAEDGLQASCQAVSFKEQNKPLPQIFSCTLFINQYCDFWESLQWCTKYNNAILKKREKKDSSLLWVLC